MFYQQKYGIPKDPQAAKLLAKADMARTAFYQGEIDRDTAKADIMPYIEYVNEKAKTIAKKYGQRAKKISFNGFMR